MGTIRLPKLSAQEHPGAVWPAAGITAQRSSPVRVGVLMDGPAAPLWVHQTIAEILRTEHLDLSLLVMKAHDGKAETSAPVLLRAWTWADRQLFKGYLDALALERREYSIDTIVACAAQRDGGSLVVSKDDEAGIKAANLDVIVNLASDVVPVHIKTCARFGVWTFLSGNGEPESDYVQFQDVFEDNRISTLILCAMNATGQVDLYRSTFANDALSVYRNRNATCWRKSQIFLRLLSDLYQKGWPALQLSTITPDSVLQATDRPSFPGTAEITRFLQRWSLRTSRRWLSNLAFSERWFIAYQDKHPISDQSASLKMIIPPNDWHYADPFMYERSGKHYIFFETSSCYQPTNEIWFVELDDDGNPSRPERALKTEYNLSYPFIFDYGGEIYLMPESSQNRAVEIHRAAEFPWHWELAGTLLENVPAVDATLLERNGKFWLFTSGIGGEDLKCSELSLFFSDSLFGPWIAHPKNPIVCDIRRARPAGRLFHESGELIRPGQDCAECYGHAISLNRVELLSETDYHETTVSTILPNWAPGLSANHTLNMDSRYEVLDGKSRTTRYGFTSGARRFRMKWPVGHRLVQTAKKDPAAIPGLGLESP
jgi:hypothetical protein